MAKEFQMHWGSKCQDSIGSDLNHIDNCEIINMDLSDVCLTEQEKSDSKNVESKNMED